MSKSFIYPIVICFGLITQSALAQTLDNPPVLKGIQVHQDDPFVYDFFVDPGRQPLSAENLNAESLKLIRYFLACLTVPEKDLWVNLAPGEENRIIPQSLEQTEMGQVLLAQDLDLKHASAALLNPRETPGQVFWREIKRESGAVSGEVNSFREFLNRIWIVPSKAVVFADMQGVFIKEACLKVLAESVEQKSVLSMRSLRVLKETVLPKLEKKVNTSPEFALLRQVYHSFIIAAWYKKEIQQNAFSKMYVDQNAVSGIDLAEKNMRQNIFRLYLSAFDRSKGQIIDEEVDENTGDIVVHKYFSGGVEFGTAIDFAFVRQPLDGHEAEIFKMPLVKYTVRIRPFKSSSAVIPAINELNQLNLADWVDPDLIDAIENIGTSAESSLKSRDRTLRTIKVVSKHADLRENIEKALRPIHRKDYVALIILDDLTGHDDINARRYDYYVLIDTKGDLWGQLDQILEGPELKGANSEGVKLGAFEFLFNFSYFPANATDGWGLVFWHNISLGKHFAEELRGQGFMKYTLAKMEQHFRQIFPRENFGVIVYNELIVGRFVERAFAAKKLFVSQLDDHVITDHFPQLKAYDARRAWAGRIRGRLEGKRSSSSVENPGGIKFDPQAIRWDVLPKPAALKSNAHHPEVSIEHHPGFKPEIIDIKRIHFSLPQ